MNFRVLTLLLGILLVLCPYALAQESMAVEKALVPQKITGALTLKSDLPDLVVKSASVMGPPMVHGQLLLVPLEIVVKNEGGNTSAEFNVGAEAKAVDGNAYGFDYYVPGEATMEGRGGVLVRGMTTGTVSTYRGFVLAGPNPQGQPLDRGTKYEVRAMVDYNLDPDSSKYEWGVAETNDTNNEVTVVYPKVATMVMPGLATLVA